MSNMMQIIDLKESAIQNNDADAERLRKELKEKHLLYVNIMSSPGSGKTSVLTKVIEKLKDQERIGVMEADIDSDVDALTIEESGVKAIQLHTGGMCHLDADMSRQGLKALGTEDLDVVFLENVGNLVCPAEFDTGAMENVVILSVPEGDDKPLKYPLMFTKCDMVLVNKMDALEVFDFDLEKCTGYIHDINPQAEVIPVSAKTGYNISLFCDWLKKKLKEVQHG